MLDHQRRAWGAVMTSSSEPFPSTLADVVRDAVRPGLHSRNPYQDLSSNREQPKFETARSRDPLQRLFGSEIGEVAVSIVGNEERTLGILEAISTDVLLQMLEAQGFFRGRGLMRLGPEGMDGSGMRAVVIPARSSAPATLVLLEPGRPAERTEAITEKTEFDIGMIEKIAYQALQEGAAGTGDASLLQQYMLDRGPSSILDTLRITQPEIVLSRQPRMVRLCAPWPALQVECSGQISTAGIFCRDAAGRLGVTACYHGTGPVGTRVKVGFKESAIAIASNVQDTVFVPLDDGYNIPQLRGCGGVLAGRAPRRDDHAEFHGVTSGAMQTQITSYDAGILRLRPAIQLRVQTGADTNTGDSGSALVDPDDKVIGFAFERTAFGERPEMTDWIWAANALGTLGLTPV